MQDGTVTLVVRDDGIGFEPAMRFGAVQQGHIGLAAVAERVVAAGGRLDIDSAPGKGTAVVVALPLNGSAAE